MYHWVKDCPHRSEHGTIRCTDKEKSEEEPEERNITLWSLKVRLYLHQGLYEVKNG